MKVSTRKTCKTTITHTGVITRADMLRAFELPSNAVLTIDDENYTLIAFHGELGTIGVTWVTETETESEGSEEPE